MRRLHDTQSAPRAAPASSGDLNLLIIGDLNAHRMELAAVGGHSIVIAGPPDAAKILLARRALSEPRT